MCIINVSTKNTKKEIKPKEKNKRIIAKKKVWAFSNENMENQKSLLFGNCDTPEYKFLKQQIHQKTYGYKYQDIEKGIYSASEFITEPQVIELLHSSNFLCYYCKEEVSILYEYVRDQKQWTLERIDNKRGHNQDNVVIACLACNLRRRCMYYERFVFTKQMNIVKQD
jgi:hypothetical protein